MSWTGRPGSSTTTFAAGSSAVTNIGAMTRYWLGASARKYTSGVCSSYAARSARVGLVDRTGAVCVCEQSAGLVERVGVRVVKRRRQRQRGWAALLATAMDSALERPEADPLTPDDEAFA